MIDATVTAYEEGRLSWSDGFRVNQNPYPQSSDEWTDWRRGWEDGRMEDADYEPFIPYDC